MRAHLSLGGGAFLIDVVLDCIGNEAEQTRGSRPVSRTPSSFPESTLDTLHKTVI